MFASLWGVYVIGETNSLGPRVTPCNELARVVVVESMKTDDNFPTLSTPMCGLFLNFVRKTTNFPGSKYSQFACSLSH